MTFCNDQLSLIRYPHNKELICIKAVLDHKTDYYLIQENKMWGYKDAID